jgi:hypothetical protein
MRREAARFRPPRELLAGQFVFRAGAIKRAQFFAAEFQGDFNRRAGGGFVWQESGVHFPGGLVFFYTGAQVLGKRPRRGKCGQFKGRVPKIRGVFGAQKSIVSALYST